MKILTSIVAFIIATAVLVSCGSFGKTTASQQSSTVSSPVVSASSNGRAAGMALHSLYGQYKADGRIDMANISNLINIATLASNLQGLKNQPANSGFYNDFAAGLILGSNNLISHVNSQAVMEGLTGLVKNVDFSGVSQAAANLQNKAENAAHKGAEVVQNANAIATSVGNILSVFKK